MITKQDAMDELLSGEYDSFDEASYAIIDYIFKSIGSCGECKFSKEGLCAIINQDREPSFYCADCKRK